MDRSDLDDQSPSRPGIRRYPAGAADRPEDSFSRPGSEGYRIGTAGYPERENEQCEESRPLADISEPFIDLDRFIEPREVARLRLISSDQPIAHDGKAGWAVERMTMNAVWIAGEGQWEVMARSPQAPRDEPGLTDVPEHGGLPVPWSSRPPTPADVEYEARRKARRVQVGLKLTPEQAEILDAAAALFGASRTTLARLLVVRGAREIVAKAPVASSE